MDTSGLLKEALSGSPQALGRLISLVEDGAPEGYAALRTLHSRAGRAYLVGVTGPPGVGKSTLVDALTGMLRRRGRMVAVIAVDPTSPFSGGAVLGDRIRMQDHATDRGVFIRSMATRGSLGGLAPATTDVAQVLDAIGYDVVFIETVGTGQAEVDVVGAADTVAVVLVPGLGDVVQTMKAGIMEIGEVFVVNKADHGDADRTVAEVQMMLQLSPQRDVWRPPVLQTVATSGQGMEAVLQSVEDHRRYLSEGGRLEQRRKDRRRAEILRVVEVRARDHALDRIRRSRLDELVERVYAGEIDSYAAAEMLIGSKTATVQSKAVGPGRQGRRGRSGRL